MTTFPCVCICMQSKSGLAGAGAIDCCPEPSVHDWETGCEVTRQDGTIRGSWAFPFRWTTFCWSARDFCSLLRMKEEKKDEGRDPMATVRCCCARFWSSSFLLGGERR